MLTGRSSAIPATLAPPHPPKQTPRRATSHISTQRSGDTPLHGASFEGQVAVVQYLVETAKADVEAKNVSEGVSEGVR